MVDLIRIHQPRPRFDDFPFQPAGPNHSLPSRPQTPKMTTIFILVLSIVGWSTALSTTERPIDVPPCPRGSRPLLRPDGMPRKCLPHQNSLCVNALPDKPDANTVCCYNNQVDYFCCLDTTADQCPDYHQVTVVIHNSVPQNPFAMKSFFFREGIEDELVDAAINNQLGEEIRSENGLLVRHPVLRRGRV